MCKFALLLWGVFHIQLCFSELALTLSLSPDESFTFGRMAFLAGFNYCSLPSSEDHASCVDASRGSHDIKEWLSEERQTVTSAGEQDPLRMGSRE